MTGIELSDKTRFSVFVAEGDYDGLRDLQGWIDHFKARGIKAELGRTKDGYAVYRNGLVQQEFNEED